MQISIIAEGKNIELCTNFNLVFTKFNYKNQACIFCTPDKSLCMEFCGDFLDDTLHILPFREHICNQCKLCPRTD